MARLTDRRIHENRQPEGSSPLPPIGTSKGDAQEKTAWRGLCAVCKAGCQTRSLFFSGTINYKRYLLLRQLKP